ncbi:VOC family protein [Parabacteroides pacaensis]|uniref:VOC family protein n=1 Tax=Parabacteroides pacaensis TaxID=2086575 RepID=UPI000D106436|nr:VOC family protein [Parabacteroides pacaensis]
MKNLIAFFEIPATDFKRAVDFYETVLDVTLSSCEWEEEKMAFFVEQGETVGSISYTSYMSDFRPSSHGVLIHFSCNNLKETLQKVVAKGGKIVIPITKIQADNKGYFAVFADTEGNHIGLYAD